MKSKILIIDDEPANLESVVSIFEELEDSYELYQANDGLLGFNIASEIVPDLVITDWNMPNSGLDLVKRMKEVEALMDIPVIIFTGVMTSPEHLQTALDAGATDYIEKPINPTELIARSRSMLKLAKSLQKNKELNASKDQLFSLVSHDLRNSIGGMKQLLDFLTSPQFESNSEFRARMLKTASKEVRNTYYMLDKLLNWAKSQLGSMQPKPERINLKTLIESSTALITHEAENRGVKLVNKSNEDIYIYADQDMFEAILRNLIYNSLKFTPEGGSVTVSAKKIASSQMAQVEVADSGCGIPADKLEEIRTGNKFITTYGIRGEKGSGIGLSLCNKFVQLNGGDLTINSVLDKGTTVEFLLPLEIK